MGSLYLFDSVDCGNHYVACREITVFTDSPFVGILNQMRFSVVFYKYICAE
ncbi:hypothetical protein JCM10512_172 [Bacteroides reticulotermitis JCM 10512]|uniref:Uncharacterized protein n=1 Tax=Bacteroides reticulotermitis JCM 10512 TaxID=1445607 RepID=W4UMG3_9BACE|nr:hypothetical protein JCM10512_172 [Bacteroides reticulotermitis JCM 10512]